MCSRHVVCQKCKSYTRCYGDFKVKKNHDKLNLQNSNPEFESKIQA